MTRKICSLSVPRRPWPHGRTLAAGLAGVVLCIAAAGLCDELVLKNGRKYRGLVVAKTPHSVLFTIHTAGGGRMTVRYAMGEVASLVVDGKAPAFSGPKPSAKPPKPPEPRPVAPKPAPRPRPKPAPNAAPAASGRTSTPAEIDAVIEQAGRTQPEWWGAVSLDYPRTLDLTGKYTSRKWEPQKKIGAYFYSVVTPSPRRWRPGIKLLHEALAVRKDDPLRLGQAMTMLAGCYRNFERDYARAAFWYRGAAGKADKVHAHSIVALAECYWRLGGASMASGHMTRHGLQSTPFGPAIKLWADMGQTQRALGLARAYSKGSRAPDGYLYTGNILRRLGRYDEAIAVYRKCVAAVGRQKRFQRTLRRAQGSLEAVPICQTLKIAEVPDGTYSGTTASFRGPLRVEVVVAGGRIDSVRVAQHKDDIFYTAPTDVPKRIVETQGLKDIDAITGATATSMAIVNATAKALAAGRGGH